MKKYVIWFVYFLIMCVAFDITDYLVEHNLLSSWYVFLIEVMFLSLGCLGAYLEIKIIPQMNKKPKK